MKVIPSCLTVCDPMDSTDHGILQARILEWVAFPFSRGSSRPRDGTQVSHIAGGFFTNWAIRESPKWIHFFTIDEPTLTQRSHTKSIVYITVHYVMLHILWVWTRAYVSIIISSVAQSCSTLCDLMDCSTSGFPVHHQLPELAQTHVHWVGDAILPSHPLLSPSPPAFNLSQHQGVFQWVSSSHWGQSMRVSASASILPMNIQDWFPLRLTVIYICIHIHIYLSIWEGISIPPVHFCCGPKTVKNRGVQCIGPMGTQAVEEGETHVGSSPPETSFFPTSLVFFHKSA